MTTHSTDPPGGNEDATAADGGDRTPTRPAADDERRRSSDRRHDDFAGGGPARRGGLRRALWTVRRVLLDVLVLTGWVVVLTALFLATAWPRWAFYALLLGGIVGYVQVTAR